MMGLLKGRARILAPALSSLLVLALSAYGFFEAYFLSGSQSILYSLAVVGVGILSVPMFLDYFQAREEKVPEVFSLLLLVVLGALVMIGTTHLLVFIFGLEILSLSLYVMAGLRREDLRSAESSLKYFILGSVALAFTLMGLSFLYGVSGQLDLNLMAETVIAPEFVTLFKIGIFLFLLGLCFKVAAVPLHFWAPDVYQGAPMPVTGLMAVVVKLASFAALLKFLFFFYLWEHQQIAGISLSLDKFVLFLSLASMAVGTLAALRQKSVKRLLAYSGIAHGGYILLGLSTGWGQANELMNTSDAVLFYLISYAVMSLGVFTVLSLLSRGSQELDSLEDLKGLSKKHPLASAFLAFFFISMAGIPPMTGFMAKYLIFKQAIYQGLWGPTIFAVLMSAVAFYYYLVPVIRMYFQEESSSSVELPKLPLGAQAVLVLLILAILGLGIFPDVILAGF
ncbi:MAG: NADH-quinone oxidoreductase subunit N [Deltaproteobacteria bacterium]|nr:NADH-quinone oxidoreductase subunit N [Deltaproteobacteria bacterium]